MALKAAILLLSAFLLLFTVEVSTNEEERHAHTDRALAAAPAPYPPASSPVASPPPLATAPPPPGITYVDVSECPKLCVARCAKNSRPNHCHRACGTCCARCRCVPPGTYGNREMCGSCYTDMTTHNNRPKCP